MPADRPRRPPLSRRGRVSPTGCAPAGDVRPGSMAAELRSLGLARLIVPVRAASRHELRQRRSPVRNTGTPAWSGRLLGEVLDPSGPGSGGSPRPPRRRRPLLRLRAGSSTGRDEAPTLASCCSMRSRMLHQVGGGSLPDRSRGLSRLSVIKRVMAHRSAESVAARRVPYVFEWNRHQHPLLPALHVVAARFSRRSSPPARASAVS